MNKMLSIALGLGTLVFLGCAETNVVKDEVKKEVSQSEKKYIVVIEKTIKDCKEHGIVLDEQKTSDFIHRSPLKTIEKAAEDKAPSTKKLCQFFAEETSDEKIDQIEVFTAKIVASCEKVGVSLPKDKIHNKVQNLPFFVIKKGLALKGDSSVAECELMERKYK